jgi:hypothetical protein
MPERELATIESELAALRRRVAQLETEAAGQRPDREWTRRFYLSYYATAGFFLGMLAALASLLFNVIGSALIGQHPLQFIRVYLTFGIGERALDLQLDRDGGLTLIIGCCLYIATGMVLGSLLQVALAATCDAKGFGARIVVASVLALLVWLVNFYLLLSWIQPLLFGGNWILTRIPWWVAAATHLVFGWTMAVVYPLGRFEPYRVRTE